MIVYAESNFILELAFHQEDCKSCEEIVELAEAGSIQLVLPAYCIGEPYERMVRRDRQRRDVHRKLTDELRELRRSAPFADSAAKLTELTTVLVEAGEQEMNHLNNTLTRLLSVASLIPVEASVIQEALAAQSSLGLSPQDSIVYASVRSRVRTAGVVQLFVNKNVKDFLIPQIEEEFTKHRCKLIPRFADGLGYINTTLSRGK